MTHSFTLGYTSLDEEVTLDLLTDRRYDTSMALWLVVAQWTCEVRGWVGDVQALVRWFRHAPSLHLPEWQCLLRKQVFTERDIQDFDARRSYRL